MRGWFLGMVFTWMVFRDGPYQMVLMDDFYMDGFYMDGFYLHMDGF